MKTLRLLSFALIVFSLACLAQSNPIDSLKRLLDVAEQDTNRVMTLLELSRLNFSDAPDEAIRYANDA
ncbi:MAG: hypothetical protein JNL88_04275, partial [Bacteroidia bacterium]|nr:hypothetical protein [Bacteroidia bacterium]